MNAAADTPGPSRSTVGETLAGEPRIGQLVIGHGWPA
jgi:hypothetical protein